MQAESQAGVEIDIPGLVLEVVEHGAAVIVVVTDCRLNVDAETLVEVQLQAGPKHRRELDTVLSGVTAHGFGTVLDSCLDVEIGLHSTDGIEVKESPFPQRIGYSDGHSDVVQTLFSGSEITLQSRIY